MRMKVRETATGIAFLGLRVSHPAIPTTTMIDVLVKPKDHTRQRGELTHFVHSRKLFGRTT